MRQRFPSYAILARAHARLHVSVQRRVPTTRKQGRRGLPPVLLRFIFTVGSKTGAGARSKLRERAANGEKGDSRYVARVHPRKFRIRAAPRKRSAGSFAHFVTVVALGTRMEEETTRRRGEGKKTKKAAEIIIKE